MNYIVWFSLASSVKVSQIFDCLPFVFCSINILRSSVEREAFSKTLLEIGDKMVIAGNSSATEIELSFFVMIWMRTARKVLRGTRSGKAGTLYQKNIQAACY